MGRRALLISAAVLLAVVIAAAFVLLRAPSGETRRPPPDPVTGTNLALDVRLIYDANVFSPAPFDDRAEYPLRLDADGFSFYGKRIRGLGRLLAKDPAPLLYDFVGSQHVESFERWFGLEPVGEPLYEDATIGGRLGLHQQLTYRKTPQSRGWPTYFPPAVIAPHGEQEQTDPEGGYAGRMARGTGVDVAYIEGWALFTDSDLFFFQAISAEPLTAAQRDACTAVMDSMEFDVLLAPPEQPADEAEDAPLDKPPAAEGATDDETAASASDR